MTRSKDKSKKRKNSGQKVGGESQELKSVKMATSPDAGTISSIQEGTSTSVQNEKCTSMQAEPMGMQMITQLMQELRAGQAEIQDSIRQTNESLNKKIDRMVKDINTTINNKLKGLKDEFALSIGTVRAKVERLDEKYKELESVIKECKSSGSNEEGPHGNFQERLRELEEKQNNIEDNLTNLTEPQPDIRGNTARQPYDSDVTIIVTGVKYEADESVTDKANQLIHEGLKKPNVTVVRAMRTPFRDTKPGILKIEFDTLQSKIEVLREKTALKQYKTLGQKVFIRGSRTHIERIVERNFQTVLSLIPGGSDYRITGSGRMVIKNDNDTQTGGIRDQRNHDREPQSNTRPNMERQYPEPRVSPTRAPTYAAAAASMTNRSTPPRRSDDVNSTHTT